MKDDALNLVATYTTLAEAVTWLFTAAALLLAGFAAWAIWQIVGRLTAAIQQYRDIDADQQRLLAALTDQPKEEL